MGGRQRPGTTMGKNGAKRAEYLRHPVSILSPLRYPGAKRRLAGYIGESLRLNGLRPRLFVEPFAGGASVSLQLAQEGLVERIALGEADPLIASFWKVVFADPEWLIAEMGRQDVTVAQWKLYKNARLKTDKERAFACLFLNRTSFSGILAPAAGPIGGFGQASEYSIDCRFNVDTLSKRIRQVAALKDMVEFVANADYRTTIKRAAKARRRHRDRFYYVDPPFFAKADKLYSHYFEVADHIKLRDVLVALKSHWLLSYDPAEYVSNLYHQNGHTPRHIDLLYSASGSNDNGRGEAQELIISNLARLPRRTRIWRSKAEWTDDRPLRPKSRQVAAPASP